jgi:hypothetical protein
MATASKSIINTYEYMNESQIDEALKCIICTQPFVKPVSLHCQHTFCRECIRTWLNEDQSCPTCRLIIDSDDEQFAPVNTHVVVNQLDRLLVQCNQCQEKNIQRGNFRDHQSKCTKQLVSCLAADLKCSWKGPRNEQDTHAEHCSFQQLRPLIDLLYSQLDNSLQTQSALQEKLEHQSEQITFLLAFINQGNTMSKECSKLFSRCQYSIRMLNKDKTIFQCTICESNVRRRHVALHACSLNEHIDCICQSCYEKQYPVFEETDEEE